MRYLSLVYFILLFSCDNTSEKKSTTEVTSAVTDTTGSSLKNAIEKHPDSLLLRETLIQQYREANLYDLALSETQKLIAKDSTNPALYNMQAILYFENEDTFAAIGSLEKSLRIYPDREQFVSLGTLYAETRDKRAFEIADILLQNFKVKSEKDAYYIRGLYYSFTGEKQKAIELFDKALSINYTFTNAYREKAIALYDLQRYQEALEVLDKAVTLYNNFDEGYYYRGVILEKLNKPADAIDSYERALLYDPEYKEAKAALRRLKNKNYHL